ncbi:hypothetical protein SLE2022_324260 [Rubroshorea leprosula]
MSSRPELRAHKTEQETHSNGATAIFQHGLTLTAQRKRQRTNATCSDLGGGAFNLSEPLGRSRDRNGAIDSGA